MNTKQIFTVKNIVLFSVLFVLLSNWYYIFKLFETNWFYIEQFFTWIFGENFIFIIIRFIILSFLLFVASYLYGLIKEFNFEMYISKKCLFAFVLLITAISDLIINNFVDAFSFIESDYIVMLILVMITTLLVLLIPSFTYFEIFERLTYRRGVKIVKKIKWLLFKKGELIDWYFVKQNKHTNLYNVYGRNEITCREFVNKEEAENFVEQNNKEISNL